MNFSNTFPDTTKLYHFKFRINEGSLLEQFVDVIQHRPVGGMPVGIRSFWELVQIDGQDVRVCECPENSDVIKILNKSEGGIRNILGINKFFIDSDNFLCAEVWMFKGSLVIKSVAWIMQGPKHLSIAPL